MERYLALDKLQAASGPTSTESDAVLTRFGKGETLPIITTPKPVPVQASGSASPHGSVHHVVVPWKRRERQLEGRVFAGSPLSVIVASHNTPFNESSSVMGVCFAGPSSPLIRSLLLNSPRLLTLGFFLFSLRLEVSTESPISLALPLLRQLLCRFSFFEHFATALLQRNVMRRLFRGPTDSTDYMDSDTADQAKTLRRHTIAPTGAQTAPSRGSMLSSMDETQQQPPPSPTASTTSQQSPSLTSGDSNRSSALFIPSDATSSDRQQKRLSLNFPIQPSNGRRQRPQSWLGVSTLPPPVSEPSPTSANFLTSLAAQERRVLELKEELQKAEKHLTSLKKHWATHEAARKRSDARTGTQPLRPLNTSMANIHSPTDDSDEQSFRHREIERRKSLLSAPRHSSRTVFSGSTHTRQLSLLSPDKSYAPSFPQPADLKQENEPTKTVPPTRSSTTSDLPRRTSNAQIPYDINVLQSEAIRTGKKMATDFKDGLWTFIEDLRQATVGEEGVNGAQNRPNQQSNARKIARQSSKGDIIGSKRADGTSANQSESPDLIDIGGSFWKEHGLDDSKSSSKKQPQSNKFSKTPQRPSKKAIDDEGESWDTWDTPNDKGHGPMSSNNSVSDGRTTPRSARSTPRSSTSSTNEPGNSTPNHFRKDSIPWPALEQLSPTNLKRTATHLMKEWEKNLTPPPEAREATSSGDYIGRSWSPTLDAAKKAK